MITPKPRSVSKPSFLDHRENMIGTGQDDHGERNPVRHPSTRYISMNHRQQRPIAADAQTGPGNFGGAGCGVCVTVRKIAEQSARRSGTVNTRRGGGGWFPAAERNDMVGARNSRPRGKAPIRNAPPAPAPARFRRGEQAAIQNRRSRKANRQECRPRRRAPRQAFSVHELCGPGRQIAGPRHADQRNRDHVHRDRQQPRQRRRR